jgi:hypothetical protein
LIQECPHCHLKVYIGGNGRCPSCGRIPSTALPDELDRTRITIAPGERLPQRCYRCGEATEEVCFWKGQEALPGGKPPVRPRFNLLSGFFIGAKLVSDLAAKEMEFAIPRCRNCSPLDRPRPVDVDYPAGRATFLVHRELAERLQFHRSGKAAEPGQPS